MNKKGQYFQMMNIYTFFFIVILILAVGLFLVLGTAALNMVGDTVIPLVADSATDSVGAEAGAIVGMAGTVNSALPWVVGVVYVLALVFILVLAYAFRVTGEKYLLVLYLILSIAVILAAVISSNIYQDFYTGSNALALELQAMSLMSYLILYSPMIFSVLLAIGAIIVFSGLREAEL